MLTDKAAFDAVEQLLTENGTIAQFEAENGPVTGRMLVDLGEIPSTLRDEVQTDDNTVIFRGSFDFCNSAVGIALNVKTLKPMSRVWMEEQKLGAYQVSEEFVRYFLAVLVDGIHDGTYSVPIYCFLNDTASFEVYPSAE